MNRDSGPVGQYKRSNIHIIRVPEGEKKERESKRVLKKVMTKNFPDLAKDTNLQIQEIEQTPTKQIQRNSCQDISLT